MDSRERFSQRVEDYVKYRPSYPEEMITKLKEIGIISSRRVVADIGSGTGIFSKLLLPHVKKLYAVEPNGPMRKTAENFLNKHFNFISIDGSGEATTLNNHSVDSIFVAQAFHWFDQEKAAQEFSRILRENGYVVLIWNERQTEESDFLKGYEDLLRDYAADYTQVNHAKFTAEILKDFFAPSEMKYQEYQFIQRFNWDQTLGRLHSCSYCPEKETREYSQLTSGLRELYDEHKIDGIVEFLYLTRVFFAKWP